MVGPRKTLIPHVEIESDPADVFVALANLFLKKEEKLLLFLSSALIWEIETL